MTAVSREELESISQRFAQAVENRRKAEKILDKLILEREKLITTRDMLYNVLIITGADIKRMSRRIVNKFAKLVEMKSDLRSDITTSTLTELHKDILLEQIDKYMRDIEKAFDEEEMEKAVSHLKNMLSMVKTMTK